MSLLHWQVYITRKGITDKMVHSLVRLVMTFSSGSVHGMFQYLESQIEGKKLPGQYQSYFSISYDSSRQCLHLTLEINQEYTTTFNICVCIKAHICINTHTHIYLFIQANVYSSRITYGLFKCLQCQLFSILSSFLLLPSQLKYPCSHDLLFPCIPPTFQLKVIQYSKDQIHIIVNIMLCPDLQIEQEK